MNVSTLRHGALLVLCLLVGALLGAFSVFLSNPNTRLKPVAPVQGLAKTSGEVLNNVPGVGLGSFAVHHVSGANEALSITSSQGSYPVVLIRKTDPDTISISISDKQQNILSGDLKNENFEMTSYLNIGPQDLRLTSIDMNADGTYDLVAQQTKDSTEARFFFQGQWYPYKGEKGKWMIQTPDGWREIIKGPGGFQFR